MMISLDVTVVGSAAIKQWKKNYYIVYNINKF